MKGGELTAVFESVRRELTAYVSRLVARPALAEDIVQSTYVKAFEAPGSCPAEPARVRAWLFRIATNTAIDELRRHAGWRESAVQDLREHAEADPAFVKASIEMIGTPETAAIAKEHVAACFACTLRNFPAGRAAALLLKEVHGFSLSEIAEWLGEPVNRVKNWLQETRAVMSERYGTTCALVTKAGVCYQCVELSEFFRSGEGNPLGTQSSLDARLALVRGLRDHPTGSWHRLLLSRLDDL